MTSPFSAPPVARCAPYQSDKSNKVNNHLLRRPVQLTLVALLPMENRFKAPDLTQI
jgi:hypothetical protein